MSLFQTRILRTIILFNIMGTCTSTKNVTFFKHAYRAQYFFQYYGNLHLNKKCHFFQTRIPWTIIFFNIMGTCTSTKNVTFSNAHTAHNISFQYYGNLHLNKKCHFFQTHMPQTIIFSILLYVCTYHSSTESMMLDWYGVL